MSSAGYRIAALMMSNGTSTSDTTVSAGVLSPGVAPADMLRDKVALDTKRPSDRINSVVDVPSLAASSSLPFIGTVLIAIAMIS
jgi:hypothetical protein